MASQMGVICYRLFLLYSKSYFLIGGTEIPENADMDTYKTPGNYYCHSSSVAKTLTNCPFDSAFTMKIEESTGRNGYICQTYRQYNTGAKAYRFFNLDADPDQWKDYALFSGDIGAEQYMFTARAEYTADCNDLTQPGFYKKVITPNNGHSPGFYAYILVLKGMNYEGTKSHFTQVAFPYNSSNQIVSRHGEGDTWSEWA